MATRCSKGRGQGQRQDQPRHRDEFEDGDHHGIHAADGAAETGGAHDGQPTVARMGMGKSMVTYNY